MHNKMLSKRRMNQFRNFCRSSRKWSSTAQALSCEQQQQQTQQQQQAQRIQRSVRNSRRNKSSSLMSNFFFSTSNNQSSSSGFDNRNTVSRPSITSVDEGFFSDENNSRPEFDNSNDSLSVSSTATTDSRCSTDDQNGSGPEITEEMRDKAYDICRRYLSGEWNNISPDDMVFKSLSGGLSNLLYYCSLPATHTPVTGEPSQVLLRMYGQLLDKNELKITESVVTMLLSERNLCPKLFGIFPEGRLEEYIPARSMHTSELKNSEYSATIARKLATVHQLNVPINKQGSWLFDTMKDWLSTVRTGDLEGAPSPEIGRRLLEFDFESEIESLKCLLEQVESPIVFCHNDLQEGNILLPSDPKMLNTSRLSDSHIVFIDFEYCAYNYRGFDLGNHFCEHMIDYSSGEWPHFTVDERAWPVDQEMAKFASEYLKQSTQLKSYGPIDTEEHLVMEANVYCLASHLLWSLWSINNARTSKIVFGYWEYGNFRLDAYLKQKKLVIAKYNLVD